MEVDRVQEVYAHTAGTLSFIITSEFTASVNHINIQGAGLFTSDHDGTPDGSGDGIMVAINNFTPVTLASGDQLTITWTITLA